MSPAVLLIVYCLLIVLASLGGGWLPMVVKLTHRRLQFALSLTAGFMLGVGLLHMLPHAIMEGGGVDTAIRWLLAGFLTMFFIERFFCFHHHDVPTDAVAHDQVETPADDHAHHHHDHCDHHDPAQAAEHQHHHDHKLSWTGAAFGLTIHSLIGGVALASAVAAEAAASEHTALFAGLAVFLVIFLHKPFDALTVITLTMAGGFKPATRHLINGLFALAVPLGAVLFYFGVDAALGASPQVIAAALAFSAGTFLCISMSDLLPELQFHHHDRGKLSTLLLVGLALAWAVATVEARLHHHAPGHGHGHAAPAADVHDDHDGHDHSGHAH